MGLLEQLEKISEGRKRMDFNEFVRKVERYMKKKNINLNGTIPQRDLRKGYEDGLYPSEFVKKKVIQMNDDYKRGRHTSVNND